MPVKIRGRCSVIQDDYCIKVKGEITPVKAIREYDFTPLVDSLIKGGMEKEKAVNTVKTMLYEIFEMIKEMEEEEEEQFYE